MKSPDDEVTIEPGLTTAVTTGPTEAGRHVGPAEAGHYDSQFTPGSIGDRASRFVQADDYVEWVRGSRQGDSHRWDIFSTGTPSAIRFWYRTSPRDLRPLDRGAVSLTDPPLTETGQRLVTLDGAGRLVEFRSVPPQYEQDTAAESPTPSWSVELDLHRADEVRCERLVGHAGSLDDRRADRPHAVGLLSSRAGQPLLGSILQDRAD